MAVRNPSSFTRYLDDENFRPRKQVWSYGTLILDDQVFLYDKQELVLSDAFQCECPNNTTTEIARYKLRGVDRGEATHNARAAVYASSDVGTNFTLNITHVGRAVTVGITVSASHTSEIWRGWADIVLYGDGTDNEILFEAVMPAGVNAIVDGVCIVTNY